MVLENDNYRDLKPLQDKCNKYVYYHATLTMTDGSSFDGIIESVDRDMITVLVGENVMEDESEEQSNEDQQYAPYRRPRRRFRRFRRRNFPLGALATLALLPYITQPPYPYYY